MAIFSLIQHTSGFYNYAFKAKLNHMPPTGLQLSEYMEMETRYMVGGLPFTPFLGKKAISFWDIDLIRYKHGNPSNNVEW